MPAPSLVQNHLGLGSQTEQYSDQPVALSSVRTRRQALPQS